MDVDAVTDSVSTLKLTNQQLEPETTSHKENWHHVNAKLNFYITNAKQLLKTPEHKKDRSHYYFEMVQERLLEDKLRYLDKHEKNNAFGEYSNTKEFLDLRRSATYWLEKLLKESISLKEKLGIPGQAASHRRFRCTDSKSVQKMMLKSRIRK